MKGKVIYDIINMLMEGCKFCFKKFDKKYKAQVFCSLLCSNRFNRNNKNSIVLPANYSEELAELFGILLGDGSVTKYFSKVYLNRIADLAYAPFVRGLISKLFIGALVTQRDLPYNGTIDIQISSKDVCDYLRSLGFDPKKRKIPEWITSNPMWIKATIRGLFDTEGSVGIKYVKGKNGNYLYKQLTVTNKNKNILKFLKKYLSMFGYKPTKNFDKNIYISNRVDIEKYLKDIIPHNPKILRKLVTREINGYIWRVAPNGKAAVLKTAAPQGA